MTFELKLITKSLMNDGLFDGYKQRHIENIERAIPDIPFRMYAETPEHPMFLVINSLLTLACCQELADGYSGAGFGMSSGRHIDATINELIGFVSGWYYAGVVAKSKMPPARYCELLSVITAVTLEK